MPQGVYKVGSSEAWWDYQAYDCDELFKAGQGVAWGEFSQKFNEARLVFAEHMSGGISKEVRV